MNAVAGQVGKATKPGARAVARVTNAGTHALNQMRKGVKGVGWNVYVVKRGGVTLQRRVGSGIKGSVRSRVVNLECKRSCMPGTRTTRTQTGNASRMVNKRRPVRPWHVCAAVRAVGRARAANHPAANQHKPVHASRQALGMFARPCVGT